MKMWRKMAMKEGKGPDGERPGQRIRRSFMMEKAVFGVAPKTYPLLSRLLAGAGVSAGYKLIAPPSESETPKEVVNETV